MFYKKAVLTNFAKFAGKHLCQSLFLKKETLTQLFSSEFCEICKNTIFTEQLWATASVWCSFCLMFLISFLTFWFQIENSEVALLKPVNQWGYSENSINPTDRFQRTFDIPTGTFLHIEPSKFSIAAQKLFNLFIQVKSHLTSIYSNYENTTSKTKCIKTTRQTFWHL